MNDFLSYSVQTRLTYNAGKSVWEYSPIWWNNYIKDQSKVTPSLYDTVMTFPAGVEYDNGAGMVKFIDEQTMMMFILKWS